MHFRKRIPSLPALLFLEAVIRHRSVTAAAAELGVTQAAVSRQIALLEQEFGRPLFIRGHRSITPTHACLMLGTALRDSFSNIADAVEVLSGQSSDMVTIGATIAFSSMWLLPRLAAFRSLHPGVQIRVVSQDTRFNIDAGDIDIVFQYGVSAPPTAKIIASTGDIVFPVCSPHYREAHDLSRFPSGGCELIETDFSSRSWIRWADWFALSGQPMMAIRPSLHFSHYTETISAARAGQGVALGWEALIRPFLEDGSLVKAVDVELNADGRHMILVSASRRRSIVTELVADWLTGALQHPS